ncbi:MAG: 7-cyano-7-deazaguanine synthase QueC [Phycisphaerales bacterium]
MSEAATAVVLLSGGLDSAVVAAWMRSRGFDVVALSFDYGQRHRVELECAAKVAAAIGAVEHRIVSLDLRAFGGSALTDEIAVPKDRPVESAGEIPVTYVPARNTVFLSIALALAEARGARDLAIGVNALDYSGYPDCRPEFIEAFARLANLATRDGVESAALGREHFRMHTPLLAKTKAEIVRLGLDLGVDFSLTTSCYDPDQEGRPCRHCDACLLRQRGFEAAGEVDPALPA